MCKKGLCILELHGTLEIILFTYFVGEEGSVWRGELSFLEDIASQFLRLPIPCRLCSAVLIASQMASGGASPDSDR